MARIMNSWKPKDNSTDFHVLMIMQLFDDDISYRNLRGANNLIKVYVCVDLGIELPGTCGRRLLCVLVHVFTPRLMLQEVKEVTRAF